MKITSLDMLIIESAIERCFRVFLIFRWGCNKTIGLFLDEVPKANKRQHADKFNETA